MRVCAKLFCVSLKGTTHDLEGFLEGFEPSDKFDLAHLKRILVLENPFLMDVNSCGDLVRTAKIARECDRRPAQLLWNPVGPFFK